MAMLYIHMELLIQKEIILHTYVDCRYSYIATYLAIVGNFQRIKVLKTSQSKWFLKNIFENSQNNALDN